ncbi:unknown [Clostridium sp. CAG:568]|nr:unknown [Clostridium sp. CAG:568]
MKKKVRNNKVILASILALGCLTAASVGFSSWVIGAQNISTKSNVDVTVDDVKDHRFNVDASSKSKIKLGPSTKGPYISYSGNAPEEALDFSFSLTFTANDGKAFDFTSLGDQSFNINFSFTDTLKINDDGYEYIKFPSGTIGTISSSPGFTESTGVTATQNNNEITYNGALAWGSYFDGQNPSLLNDPKDVDSYITGLNHLKKCLKDNAAFEIKVNIVKK